MKRIHVVAAIIFNHDKNKIFITKRFAHLHQGGYWEFPGGKVDADESPEQAIKRELFEEIGIEAFELQIFSSFDYDYDDKALTFDFFIVTQFHHQPFGKEGQVGQWIALSKLKEYSFPAANQAIVNRVMKEFNEVKLIE